MKSGFEASVATDIDGFLSHNTVLNTLVADGLINELKNPDGFGYREIVKDTRDLLRRLEVRLHRTMAKQGGGRR